MEKQLRLAARHLSQNDAHLAPVIARRGLAHFVPHTDYYRSLTDSIISQQLSVTAAASIQRRFRELFGGDFPAPELLLQKSLAEVRSVGLSGAKAHYIRDLAAHISDGRLTFDKLDQQSNEQIIAELTDVTGIGDWTAHMFLMFCLGRLDVLPIGDLGIRHGLRALYHLPAVPTPTEVRDLAVANHWHPYESVASWYVWESLDNKPKV
ncbi:MAG: DNA-3-methyladenine glycosylase 2 family protein [Candidatus Saccharibacteria bacterium]